MADKEKVFLVFGRSGTGKTKYCYDNIFKHSYNDDTLDFKNSAVYVVPEQYTFQSDKSLIEAGGRHGILNIEVLSFLRLAYRVSKEVGGYSRKKITPIGKQLILFEVLRKNKKKLISYAKSASKPGFVSMLGNQLAEFKRYMVDDEKFEGVFDVLDDSNQPLLKNKLNDLQLLYNQYEKVLEEKTLCENNELDLLIANIPDSEFVKNTHFYFDCFDGYTEQEIRIIGLIMKYAKSCTITFCYDKSKYAGQVFGQKKRLIERFAQMSLENTACDAKIVDLNEEAFNQPVSSRFSNNKTLAHVEKYFAGLTKAQYEGDSCNDIAVFRGNNPYDEVENAAQTIVQLCKERGYKYSEIAVVTPSLERYRNLARIVFDEYEIPIYLDLRNPVLENKLAVYFIYAVQCLTENWRSEDVFTYLRSGYSNIPNDDIETLNTYVKAHGISGNKWTKGDWKYPSLGEYTLEWINDLRKAVVSPLLDLKEACDLNKTGKGIAGAFYDFLLQAGVPEKIEKHAEDCVSNNMPEKAGEVEQVWSLLIELLEQIYLVIGDSPLYYNSLSDMLTSAFESVSAGVVPYNDDCVMFGTTERSRTVNGLKALIVLGADDRSFPTALGSTSLFSDNERVFLSENGMKLAPSAVDMSIDEPFKIYSTLTSASDFLMMSYCVMGAEREKLRRASTITKLIKTFPNIKEYSPESYNIDDGKRLTEKPAYRLLMYYLAEIYNSNYVNDEYINSLLYLYKYFNEHPDYSMRLKDDIAKILYKDNSDWLAPEIIQGLYGKELRGSSSMLETFSKCPFRFFVDYGLRIRAQSFKIYDSANSGTLLHFIMETYFKKIVDGKLLEDTSFDETKSAEVIDDIINSVPADSVMLFDEDDYVSRYFVDSVRKRAKFVAWAGYTALASSDFKPFAFELMFNDRKNGALKSFRIVQEDVSVVLNGVIDRVDVFVDGNKAYVRVVDYKSSNKSFDYVNACHGIDMQLLIYMNVLMSDMGKKLIKERFGVDEVYPAGMFYQTMALKTIGVDNSLMIDEWIEKKRLEEYKLKGMVLNDEDIVKSMDNSLKTSSNSLSLPVGFKASGEFKANSYRNLWTSGEMQNMLDDNKEVISNIILKVKNGTCAPVPYHSGNKDGCEYCEYASFCGWDNKTKRYPCNESLSREEWMQILEEKHKNISVLDTENILEEGDE